MTPNTNTTFEEVLTEQQELAWRAAGANQGNPLGQSLLDAHFAAIRKAHNADKAKSLEEAIKGEFYSKVTVNEAVNVPLVIKKQILDEFVEAVYTKLESKLCLKDALLIPSALDEALSLMENK